MTAFVSRLVRKLDRPRGEGVRRVSAQLGRLSRPKFRIACRAADWYGSSDGADLEAAHPDAAPILEVQLEPSERQRVFVRVLDVSWPQDKHGET